MAPIIGITCKTTEDDMENYINATTHGGDEKSVLGILTRIFQI